MAHSIFGPLSVVPARTHGGAAFVSLAAHVLAVGVLVVAPFLSDAELPPTPTPPPGPLLPPVVLAGGGGGRSAARASTVPRRTAAPTIAVPTEITPLAPAGAGEDVPACPECVLGGPGEVGGSIEGEGPGSGPGPVGPGLEPAAVVEPLRISSLTPPRRLVFVEPEFPEAARLARLGGLVILECVIDARGRVVDVKVLRGRPLLDQAAVAAVRQWVYAPTLLGGVPVPVVMTVTVNFDVR